MTRQESFKRRVRARMEKTGERYAAARRALLTQAGTRRRTWQSTPDVGDEAVAAATGRSWEDWCDAIDASPVRGGGHTVIATHLREALGVDPWWAQTVTVGYERITGLRLPGQRPDGTFGVSRSRTVAIDRDALRAALLDQEARADLFPGHRTAVRSRPGSRNVRLEIGPGVAEISLEPASGGRTKVTVAHERLATVEEADGWRFYWGEWLEALAAG